MISAGKPRGRSDRPDVWWWCERIDSVAVEETSSEVPAHVARLEREQDRERSRAADALLRRAVGWVLGVGSEALEVTRRCRRCGATRHGQPVIAGVDHLNLSISHSGSYAAVAVSERPVGIDIEDPDGIRIGGSTAGHESGWTLSDWVRIESVLKATGAGLAVDPRSVQLIPDEAGWRLARYPDGAPAESITVDLRLPNGLVGAVTVLSRGATLHPSDLATFRNTQSSRSGGRPAG